ncbi:MAG: bifunctional precorrin-2 dehydrogenase/sirohydrochlorin ferrochelatase [Eubacteriaceae bacterium]|nr:bifunctional precorrin-2 dehydrogenase/sirohydrochlorin ferrochelatase [Eubacteriaceae bacterium]
MGYAIAVDVKNMKILIVGGGKIALRKCRDLLKEGADVTVVSQKFHEDFLELKEEYVNNLLMIEADYSSQFLKGMQLIFAATGHGATDSRISEECRKLGLLINGVGNQKLSNFMNMSSFSRGDLTLAVSTGGKSPAISGRIIRELKEHYGKEWEEILNAYGEKREKILKSDMNEESRRELLKNLANQCGNWDKDWERNDTNED